MISEIEEDIQTIIDEYYENDGDDTKTICYEDLKDDENIRKNLEYKNIIIIDESNNYNNYNLIDNIPLENIDSLNFMDEIINSNNFEWSDSWDSNYDDEIYFRY